MSVQTGTFLVIFSCKLPEKSITQAYLSLFIKTQSMSENFMNDYMSKIQIKLFCLRSKAPY